MLLPLSAVAQPDESTLQGQQRMSCTSIMVGRKASADGSVMTSHTCDSWYRTWMQIVPARDYERDTVTAIYEGRMHTQAASDSTKLYRRGVIPQVRHTYRYLDTAYPCLNEKQVAMGETTFSGRDTLQNKKGLFYIEELQRIALERCTTAREAIALMGSLAEKYGYCDSGECLTVADPNEVWIFFFYTVGNGAEIPQDYLVTANTRKRKLAKELSDDALRAAAKDRSTSIPGKRRVSSTQIERDEFVSEYAKRRASGVCMLCGQPAPFLSNDGIPYLETHHVIWLSDGGADSIDNTVALCPNCHRKMHIVKDPCDVEKLRQAAAGNT